MTYLNNSHVPAANGLPNLFALLRQSMAVRIRKNRAYRKTRAQLEAMTDRDLADMGITRFMIADIAAEAAARA